MSDTIKLIVEIPKSALELLKTTGVDWLGAEHILSAIEKGIPLEDVKAEIQTRHDSIPNNTQYDDGRIAVLEWVLDVLDNIGESEVKDADSD